MRATMHRDTTPRGTSRGSARGLARDTSAPETRKREPAEPPLSGAPASEAGVRVLVDGTPACPECGGRMWDNRTTKRNPKAPDFKCRDRDCAGRLWPGQFKGAPPVAADAPAPTTVDEPTDDRETAPPAHGVADDATPAGAGKGGASAGPLADAVRAAVAGTVRACYLDLTDFVLAEVRPRYAAAGVPCTDATVAAIAATLFIALCRGTGLPTASAGRGGAA